MVQKTAVLIALLLGSVLVSAGAEAKTPEECKTILKNTQSYAMKKKASDVGQYGMRLAISLLEGKEEVVVSKSLEDELTAALLDYEKKVRVEVTSIINDQLVPCLGVIKQGAPNRQVLVDIIGEYSIISNGAMHTIDPVRVKIRALEEARLAQPTIPAWCLKPNQDEKEIKNVVTAIEKLEAEQNEQLRTYLQGKGPGVASELVELVDMVWNEDFKKRAVQVTGPIQACAQEYVKKRKSGDSTPFPPILVDLFSRSLDIDRKLRGHLSPTERHQILSESDRVGVKQVPTQGTAQEKTKGISQDAGRIEK